VGPRCQREQGKRKRERGRGLARGEGWWAAGPLGPKGKQVRFCFCFFSFSNSF
jgi:hypothetical protein